jgi:hypothetical protein
MSPLRHIVQGRLQRLAGGQHLPLHQLRNFGDASAFEQDDESDNLRLTLRHMRETSASRTSRPSSVWTVQKASRRQRRIVHPASGGVQGTIVESELRSAMDSSYWDTYCR